MGFGIVTAVFALAAAQAGDGVPPVMVNMVEPARIEGAPLRQPPENSGWVCAAGYGDCLRIIRGDNENPASLAVFDMDAAASDIPPVPLPSGVGVEDGVDIVVWNHVIRLPNGAQATGDARSYLVGIIRRTPVGYSGGFASMQRLHLFRLVIAGGGAALLPEVVSLPWMSEAQIRACFAEEDSARRRGECRDIYRYTPRLAITTGGEDQYPALSYTTVATAFPRTARRGEDSSAAPPLTAADLSEWRDPECSYTRTLRYNPATERYEMDRVAPDCSAYTAP